MSKKELLVTSVRAILGSVPYAGSALVETLFDHRSRLKQDRINQFVQSFADYLTNFDEADINISVIQKDDFGDLFETIIRKVSITNSVEKTERFKLILANHVLTPKPMDFMDTYITLVSQLNEKQIEILRDHLNLIPAMNIVKSRISELNIELDNINAHLDNLIGKTVIGEVTLEDSIAGANHDIAIVQKNITEQNLEIKRLQKIRYAEHYGISDDEFLFYKQDLISKSLIIDSGQGQSGHIPYKFVNVSGFGKDFLNFIG